MGLRENLSRLSPNEFLEKMQDLMNMYMESAIYTEAVYSKYLKSLTKNEYLIDNFEMKDNYKIYKKGSKNPVYEEKKIFVSPIQLENIPESDLSIVIRDMSHVIDNNAMIYKYSKEYNSDQANKEFCIHMKNMFHRFDNLLKYAKKKGIDSSAFYSEGDWQGNSSLNHIRTETINNLVSAQILKD